MTTSTFTRRIHQLIAADKLKTALKEMNAALQNSPQLDEVVLQSARYSDLTRQLRRGTLDWADSDVPKSKIRYALLDLLRDIEESVEAQPELEAELNRALKQAAKQNTIHIQGNNNIGITDISNSQISINQGGSKEKND